MLSQRDSGQFFDQFVDAEAAGLCKKLQSLKFALRYSNGQNTHSLIDRMTSPGRIIPADHASLQKLDSILHFHC